MGREGGIALRRRAYMTKVHHTKLFKELIKLREKRSSRKTSNVDL